MSKDDNDLKGSVRALHTLFETEPAIGFPGVKQKSPDHPTKVDGILFEVVSCITYDPEAGCWIDSSETKVQKIQDKINRKNNG